MKKISNKICLKNVFLHVWIWCFRARQRKGNVRGMRRALAVWASQGGWQIRQKYLIYTHEIPILKYSVQYWLFCTIITYLLKYIKQIQFEKACSSLIIHEEEVLSISCYTIHVSLTSEAYKLPYPNHNLPVFTFTHYVFQLNNNNKKLVSLGEDWRHNDGHQFFSFFFWDEVSLHSPGLP